MLDRILRPFARVRPGEGGTALIMALNVFLLLSAYYVIKPVREALILSTGGAEVKSYSAVGQVILLAFLVPLYSRWVGRMKRRVLIDRVTWGFCACLLLFFVAAKLSLPFLGVLFYLFVGVFNLMVVAQFWAFANDIYRPEQGERLFALLGFGASMGAVFGSLVTSFLVGLLGVDGLLLVSAGLLLLTTVLFRLVDRRARSLPDQSVGSVARSDVAKPSSGPPRDLPREQKSKGGFALVYGSPYLLLIAGLMFFSNWVNTTGEYILGSLVSTHAQSLVVEQGGSAKDYIGKFYGDFFFVVNVAGLLLQLFFVSRLIQWLKVRGALLVLPAIALVSYLLLGCWPLLAVVRWAKTAENSTDYSLNNTVRNALFLPLSAEEKFKAKQATDTFFVRGGDVASAALVGLGSAGGLPLIGYAWINVAGVVVCLFLAWKIGNMYQDMAQKAALSAN